MLFQRSRSDVDGWAADFARRMGGRRRLIAQYRPRICPLDRLLEHVPEQASVLDIGCGAGLFLYMLARGRHLARGIGIDVNAGAISAGQRALAGEGVETVTLLRALSPDDWPLGPFDAVSLVDVMHHVPRTARCKFFEQACARVRPGGVLLYKDMATSPTWMSVANRVLDLVIAREWISYMPIDVIERLSAASGLECTHRARIDLLAFGHDLRIFNRVARVPFDRIQSATAQ